MSIMYVLALPYQLILDITNEYKSLLSFLTLRMRVNGEQNERVKLNVYGS